MKNISTLLLALVLLAHPAHADTFVTVPNPLAVWDSTLGQLSTLCPPGAGQNGCTSVTNNTGAQTLTNKTLTSPTINGGTLSGSTFTGGSVVGSAIIGPAPTSCGATCVLTAARSGSLTLFASASGSTATLPAATATGNVYTFRITTALTSAAEKILTNPTTDVIIGTAIGQNAGTAKVFVGNASTYHSIQMPFAGTQPSGGFIGDQVTCTDVAAGVWACDVNYQAGVTPTTPYSASTT